MERVA
ncbi:uncharacterized protein FTOL_13965 [Fusarium torulosum]